MSIPVRIAIRVDFADGRQHEYEVSSALAEQAMGLIPMPGSAPDIGAMALAAFFAKRLDEDKAAAGLAGEGLIAWLTYRDAAGQMDYTTVAAGGGDGGPWRADGKELPEPASVRVVWDQARELREIEAKRQVLTRWQFARNQAAVHAVNGDEAERDAWEKIAGALELDVRSAVAIWDGHPQYREAWGL